MNLWRLIKGMLLLTLLFILNPTASADPVPAPLQLVNTDIARNTNNICALRDRYGFLWVGTTTGLSCYDGNGTPVYFNHSGRLRSTANISISTLFEYGDNVWFGGTRGLYVFDRKNNTSSHFPFRTRYGVQISSQVDKILATPDNRIWICTQGQGFFIFNTADSTLTQDSRHGSFYSDMAVGSNGLVYLASLNGQIQSFRPDGKFSGTVNLPEYVMNKSRISMAASGNDIWLSSGSDLYRLDTVTGQVTRVLHNSAAGLINMLLTGRDGNIFLASDTGLWDYSPVTGQIEKVRTSTSNGAAVRDPRVTSLAADTDGNVLLVTPMGGILELLTRQPAFSFRPITDDTGSYNIVYALCPRAGSQGLWVGSDLGLGFYNLESHAYVPVSVPGLGSGAVTAITPDGTNLWLATRHSGLILFDTLTGTSRHYTYDANIPYTIGSNEVNEVFITDRGEHFVLTDGGLNVFLPETDNFKQRTEIGQNMRMVTMAEDRQGRLWAATQKEGVHFLRKGETRFVAFDSKILGAAPVTSMLCDSRGTLWMATESDGVYYFDEEAGDFVPLDVPVLKLGPITLLEEDKDGRIWIGSDNILVRIDGNRNVHYFNFSRYAGRIPVARSGCRLPSGEIALGSRNGFITFMPGMMTTDENKIKVFPRSISFPYMADDTEELRRLGLDKLLYTCDGVEIPYDHNSFTINLSSTHPVDMPQVRYDYMLSGVDQGWVVGVGSDGVTYNNLEPGTYEFLVRPSGMADNAAKRLMIKVLPPWYRTTIAYVVYVLLGLLMAWCIFILSRRRIRRHYRRRMEQMSIQKEREMFQSKTRYFVDLVHEIRTPLMLISLPLEHIAEGVVGKDAPASGRMTKYVRSMQRNLNYLLGITNQLLDFRKVENTNEINLKFSRVNLNEMLSTICHRFDEPLKADGKELTLKLPEQEITATLDAEKTERMLMNLLGNALKYSRTHVDVVLAAKGDGEVTVSVADDGPGVPEKERERIFDTYYQIGNDNVAASLGTGLGLAYAKLVAVSHKGDITVAESPRGGALFTITFPLGLDIEVADEAVPEVVEEEAAETGEAVKQDVTVMVVEDNRELRDMVTESLGRYYTILTASDGEEALKVLDSKNVDIIVSDVMMPGMDGMELCRRVKADVNYSHIPFIILTAKTGEDAHNQAMECGADVFLVKPFPIGRLRNQIANILRTRHLFYKRIRTANPLVDLKSKDDGDRIPALNRYEAEFLEKMNSIIKENIGDEEFSIDVLAENLNMSRSSFYRKITAVVGMPPGDYLKTFRLNYAAELLIDGCRVTEVASNVGFTSSSYFAKCFRDKFGMLPSEYVASRSAENGQ